MKFLIVLLAVVAVTYAGVINVRGGSTRSIASTITDIIEDFRDQMPCGFESLGIPPLAPLKIGHQEVGVHTYAVNVDGEVNQATINGLNEFEVTEMKVNVILSKVNFELVWEGVTIKSLYDLEAVLKSLGLTVRVVGKGDMLVSVVDIKVKGTAKYSLGLIGGGLKLKEFKLVISIGDVNSEIDGLLGSGIVNHKLNQIIEETILLAVNDNEEVVTSTIESFILPTVNGAIDGKTISQIIAGIGGGGGNGGESTKCEPNK